MPIHPSLVLLAQQGGGGGLTVLVIQVAAIFAIFYFLLIRPQKKEQERHQKMIESLATGDDVVTSGGIVGRIIHLDGDLIKIKTAENTRIVVQRGRIAGLRAGKGEEGDEEGKAT